MEQKTRYTRVGGIQFSGTRGSTGRRHQAVSLENKALLTLGQCCEISGLCTAEFPRESANLQPAEKRTKHRPMTKVHDRPTVLPIDKPN